MTKVLNDENGESLADITVFEYELLMARKNRVIRGLAISCFLLAVALIGVTFLLM